MQRFLKSRDAGFEAVLRANDAELFVARLAFVVVES